VIWKSASGPSTPDNTTVSLRQLHNSYQIAGRLPDNFDPFRPKGIVLTMQLRLDLGNLDVDIYSERDLRNLDGSFGYRSIPKHIVIDFNFRNNTFFVTDAAIIKILMNFLVSEYPPRDNCVRADVTYRLLHNGAWHIECAGQRQEFKTSITVDRGQIIIRILNESESESGDLLSLSLAAIRLTAELICGEEE